MNNEDNRQRVADYRRKQKAIGFTQCNVVVHEEDKEELKTFALKLRNRRLREMQRKLASVAERNLIDGANHGS